MSNHEQLEELQSLLAIYEGGSDIVLRCSDGLQAVVDSGDARVATGGAYTLDVSVTMDVGHEFRLRAAHPSSTRIPCLERSKSGEHVLTPALTCPPPLRVQIELPKDYLAEDSETQPGFQLTSKWLADWRLNDLSDELKRQADEQGPAPVLFSWIEWLRAEAAAFLALAGDFDVDATSTRSTTDAGYVPDADALLMAVAFAEDAGITKTTCVNCAGAFAQKTCAAIGTCDHLVCASCLQAVVDTCHANRVIPCCPQKGCWSRPKSMAGLQKKGPPAKNVAASIQDTAFQDCVVFCPCCEDLGVDSPVLGAGNGFKFRKEDACHCYACDWSFCGICRSPYHGTEECEAKAGRAERMTRRRPPLPVLPSQTEQPPGRQTVLADSSTGNKLLQHAIDGSAVQGAPSDKKDARSKMWQTLDLCTRCTEHKHFLADFVEFEVFRTWFLSEFEGAFREGLKAVTSSRVDISPGPVSNDVARRFMDAMYRTNSLPRPAYHGTCLTNFDSIFKRGLLIPGNKSGIRVQNGSAHGVGIYTAQVDAAWLSSGFCDSPNLLLCAVLPVKQVVRFVGDAMVVFEESYVVPLYKVKCHYFGNIDFGRAAKSTSSPASTVATTASSAPSTSSTGQAQAASKTSAFFGRRAARKRC
eukprot:TRINITY_DN10093_c0_g1_i1.p1 TRINITY_DN10093_c0_g1~~TRINITY_DN10093_c0_g1_i1.p1  ORF type:complete len:641 (+),score=72.68 TRINITY_DN10093_c0_g1_i1:89-2011(+)